MEYSYEQRVFYSDTDAYGVVWHGSYLRWLEMGRVLFCDKLGLDIVTLQKHNIVFPITNLNIRYKSSAKLNDDLIIKTSVAKISPIRVTFLQTIIDKNNNSVKLNAEIDVVAVDSEGKLYRKIPDEIKRIFDKTLVGEDAKIK